METEVALEQKLWFCVWGTMIALVWALSAENAEQKVRYQRFGRKLTLRQVMAGEPCIWSEVYVREATEEDKQLYVEWGGEVPA